MRKVLGATVAHLTVLMKGDSVKIVAIAFIIGSLLGYLFVDKFIFQFTCVSYECRFRSLCANAFVYADILRVDCRVQSCRAATSNPVDAPKDK